MINNQPEILLENQKLVSLKQAAQISGYAKDYIGYLCRTGKVEAKRLGRDWFVNEKSLLAYRAGESALKPIIILPENENGTTPAFFGHPTSENKSVNKLVDTFSEQSPSHSPTKNPSVAWAWLRRYVVVVILIFLLTPLAVVLFQKYAESPTTEISRTPTTEYAVGEKMDLQSFKKQIISEIVGKGLIANTIIEKPMIIEKTFERIISGLSKKELDAELNILNNKMLAQVADLKNLIATNYSQNFNAIALTNKIDILNGTTLINVSVNGISGLTDADIPDGITASNYLPLSGGTITGDLTITGTCTGCGGGGSGALNYGGSGSLVYYPANGTTATGTTASLLTWDNVNGNLGVGTTSPYAKLSVAGSGVFDNNVYASYFTATSTTATSTFAGGIEVRLLNVTSSTATSTFANGIQLTSGCFLLPNGECAGTGSGSGVSDWHIENNFGTSTLTSTTTIPIWAKSAVYASSTLLVQGLASFSNATATQLTVSDTAYFSGGVWNSSGNVGIGTSSPYAKLSIHADAAEATHPLFVVASSTATATTTLFTILNNGNVGIGTTTPFARLSVHASTTNANESIFAVSNATSSATTTLFTVSGSGRVSILAKQDTGGNLRFDTPQPFIYASSFITMPGGLYVSAGTLYATNNIKARGGIGNDTATVLSITGGTSGYSNFTGNVGVGSTSPYAKLSLHANATETNKVLFNVSSSTASATTSLFNILNNGMVGVGTTTPSAKFSVLGDGYFTGGLGVGVINTAAGTFKTSGSITTGSDLITQLLNCNSSAAAIQTDGSGILTCGTITTIGGASAGGWTSIAPNIVRLATTTDLVGIGITSPTAKLDINSGAAATTTLALHPVISQTANIIDIYNTSSALESVFTSGHNFGISSTTPWGRLSINNTGSGPSFVVGNSALSEPTLFMIDANGNMLVDVGNVGIGTTSPYAKLSVAGQAVAEYFTATSTSATSTLPYLSSTQSDVGTVVGGTWQGTPIGVTYGGTGQNSSAWNGVASIVNGVWSASNTLAVSSGGTGWGNFQANALLLGNGNGALATTSQGTDGQILVLVNGMPTWNSTTTASASQFGFLSANDWTSFNNKMGSTTISSLTTNYLPKWNGTTATFNNSQLLDDGTNVGVGTTSPYAKLSVVGQAVAEYFTATSTSATSTLPWLAATNFALGSDYLTDITGTHLTTTGGVLNVDNNLSSYNNDLGWAVADWKKEMNFGVLTLTPTTTIPIWAKSAVYASSTLRADGAIDTSGTTGGYKIDGNLIVQASSTNLSTLVGRSAGAALLSDGTGNTALGYQALMTATSSDNNTAVGYQALRLNTTGNQNVANGAAVLGGNTTGAYNTGIGYAALNANTTGNYNTANGTSALYSNTTGSNNTALGFYAGIGTYNTQDQRSVIDNYMTFLGFQSSRSEAVASTTALSNGIAIGYSARVGASNSMVLGAIGSTYGVNVGIGTTSPLARLTVHAEDGHNHRYLFNVSSSTASATTSLFSILNNGNVLVDVGSVGIGTTSPYAKLSVSGNIVAENNVLSSYFTATSTSATSTLPYLSSTQSNVGTVVGGTWQGGAIGQAFGGTGLTTYAAGDLIYANNAGTLARLATSTGGYVLGIDKTTGLPTYAATSSLFTSGADTLPSGTQGQTLTFQNNLWRATSTIYVGSNGNVGISTTTLPYAKLAIGAYSGTAPAFLVESSLVPDTTNFVIDVNGKVGVGTAVPTKALDVVGAISITDSGAENPTLQLQDSNSSSYYRSIYDNGSALVFSNTEVGGAISLLNTDDAATAFTLGDGTEVAIHWDNNANNLRLMETGGNVGIGTTSPYAKLSVAGQAVAEYFTATSTSATSTLPWLAATNFALGSDYLTDITGTHLTTTGGVLNVDNNLSSYNNDLGFAVADWKKEMNFGVLTLTPTTTIPIWAKGAVYASSTLRADGAIDTSGTTGGYKIDGNLIVQASSTNFSTLVGRSAGAALLSNGLYNTALGYLALQSATSSDYNTAIGALTLSLNTTGEQNTATGLQALYSNTAGSYNTANGISALYSNTTGIGNVANGAEALRVNTTGSYNTASGYWVLHNNTTGSYNTANGMQALNGNTTGSYNTADGYGALASNRTGTNNIANGALALSTNNSATSSTAIGYSAARGTAAYNNQGGVYVGYQAGYSASTNSDYNTMLGYQSGYGVTTGARNVLVGNSTIAASYNQVTTGSNNISIGNDVAVASSTLSNQLNIGNLIYGTGLSGTGATLSTGNIGIGTTSPYAKLSVSGSGVFENNVLASYFTATSTSATSTFPYLSSTQSNVGTVVGGTWQGGAIGQAFGGTGLTTYAAGDLIYANDAGALARLATSTGGYVLGIDKTTGLPTYAATSSLFTSGADTLPTGTQGQTLTFQNNLWRATSTIYVGGNGNVGIATTTLPYAKLAIGAYTGTTPAFVVESSITPDTMAFIVDANGKVGIGASVPTKALDVVGAISITDSGAENPTLQLQDSNSSNYYRSIYDNGSALVFSNTEVGGAISLLNTDDAATAFTLGDGTEVAIHWDNNANNLRLMETGGNVGIGTTSPYAKLSVVGQVVGEYFTATSTSATSTLPWLSTTNFALGSDYLTDITGTHLTTTGGVLNVDNNLSGYNNDLGWAVADWKKEMNFGVLTLTPTTTIPIWAKGAVYASSTLRADGAIDTSGTTGGYKIDGNLIVQASSTNFSTLVGRSAGAALLSDGISNTALGYQALMTATSSDYNTAVGYQALSFNTTGNYNTALGLFALRLNTTGINNTANGVNTLQANTTGSYNTANGVNTLQANTTGNYNTANGTSALYTNTTGSNNIALGYYAGIGTYNTQDQRSVIDNYMTFLGFQSSRSEAVASTTALSNGIAIGYSARVGASNSMVLGAIGSTYGVNVGIGTTSPMARLTIHAEDGHNHRYLFNISSSTASATTSLFSILNNGDVLVDVGSVGIGTTSPYAKLSVSGSGVFENNVLASYFTATSTTATSTFMGALGVGTSTPAEMLSVAGRLYVGGTGTSTIENNLNVMGQLKVGTASIYLNGNSTSTFSSGIQTPYLNITGTTATSTFSSGIDIATGCFSINGVCITGGGGGSGTINSGTTNRLSYYSGATTLSSANFLTLDTANSRLAVGTSSPYATLTAWGGTTGNIFEAVTNSSTTALSISAIGFGTTTLSGLNILGSATSTSNVGFNLTGGCFAINGVCITGGSISGTVPTLTTTAENNTTASTTNSGGTITSYGDSAITRAGIVWNTTGSPTIVSYTGSTTDTVASGVFTSTANNLTPGTTYYIRAYATNGSGTAYGNQIIVTITTTATARSYTGTMQTFTVPAGVTSVVLEAWGAQGLSTGGQGGYAKGTLAVTPGQVLNVYVGGQAGWNGGAKTAAGAASGGDASDVRTSTATSSRVIVAGGGGGSGSGGGSGGGAGGGTSGVAGGNCTATGGGGGTQSTGGAAGTGDSGTSGAGTLGWGGVGGGTYGTGGGGGYYGGGGGGSWTGGCGGAGGGGSSYITGLGNATTTTGGRNGNGGITITYYGSNGSPGSGSLWTLNDPSIYYAFGNVGVGTSSPYSKLSVSGSGVFENNVLASYFTATSTTATSTFRGGAVFGYDNSALSNFGETVDILGSFAVENPAGTDNFFVGSNGRVGVGTTSPWGKLSVEMDTTNPAFVVSNQGSTTPAFYIGGVNQNGNVGVGTSSPWRTLSVNGTASLSGLTNSVTGNYLCLSANNEVLWSATACTPSSGRYKENVAAASYGLAEVMDLNPVFFNYKSEYNFGTGRQVGFIAEDASIIMPELIGYDENGEIGGFDYPKLTAVLTKALQETVSILDIKNAATSSQTLVSYYSATGTPAIFVDAAGNIGIGTTTPGYKLTINGEAAAKGFINISTREAKKDIVYLNEVDAKEALDKIKNTNIATYSYIGDTYGTSTRLGLIAEEAPTDILSVDGKGVDLYKMTSFLWMGVKAQQSEIENMELRIKDLEEQARQWQYARGATSTNALPEAWSAEMPNLIASLTAVMRELGVYITSGVVQAKEFVADRITARKVVVETLEMKDSETGDTYCVRITNGEWTKFKGTCGEVLQSIIPNQPTDTIATSSPMISEPVTATTSADTAIIATTTPVMADTTATTIAPTVIDTATTTAPAVTDLPTIAVVQAAATPDMIIATTTPLI